MASDPATHRSLTQPSRLSLAANAVTAGGSSSTHRTLAAAPCKLDRHTAAARYGRLVNRLAVLASVVAALALVLSAYTRVEYSRMDAACTTEAPGGHHWRSVHYGWSWKPVGFQCTYDDGLRRTSLWF